MPVSAADALDDIITLSKGARDAAISNGLGNMIPVVVDAAAALYTARTIENGLLAIAKAIDASSVERGIQVKQLVTAIGKCNTL